MKTDDNYYTININVDTPDTDDTEVKDCATNAPCDKPETKSGPLIVSIDENAVFVDEPITITRGRLVSVDSITELYTQLHACETETSFDEDDKYPAGTDNDHCSEYSSVDSRFRDADIPRTPCWESDDKDDEDYLTVEDVFRRQFAQEMSDTENVAEDDTMFYRKVDSGTSSLYDAMHELQKGVWVSEQGVLWYGDSTSQIWKPILSYEELNRVISHHKVYSFEVLKAVYAKYAYTASPIDSWWFAEEPSWVSFQDGVLDVQSGEFMHHSLDLRVRYHLSIKYMNLENTKKLDLFKRVVEALAGSTENAMRLQEAMGVALSASPAGSMIFVMADNRRWAALFLHFLKRVTESRYVSSLSLRDHDSSFRTAHAVGKHLLLSFKEGESIVRDLENILRLIDGDGINADRKCTTAIEFMASTTLVCSGKRLPRIRDTSIDEAMEYLTVINLTGLFPTHLIHEKTFLTLRQEFVLWALEGLVRYLKTGHFTISKESERNDPHSSIRRFFETCIEENANASIPSFELFDEFDSYCRVEHLVPAPHYDVLNYIRAHYGKTAHSVRYRDREGNSCTASGYSGFKLKTPDERLSIPTEMTRRDWLIDEIEDALNEK